MNGALIGHQNPLQPGTIFLNVAFPGPARNRVAEPKTKPPPESPGGGACRQTIQPY